MLLGFETKKSETFAKRSVLKYRAAQSSPSNDKKTGFKQTSPVLLTSFRCENEMQLFNEKKQLSNAKICIY